LEKLGVNAVNWIELAQVESNAGCCDYRNISFAYTEKFPNQWSNYKPSVSN
jgi:hypothetical protein